MYDRHSFVTLNCSCGGWVGWLAGCLLEVVQQFFFLSFGVISIFVSLQNTQQQINIMMMMKRHLITHSTHSFRFSQRWIINNNYVEKKALRNLYKLVGFERLMTFRISLAETRPLKERRPRISTKKQEHYNYTPACLRFYLFSILTATISYHFFSFVHALLFLPSRTPPRQLTD